MINGSLTLHSFKTVLPRFSGPQTELIDWIIGSHQRSMELTGHPDRERYPAILKRFAVNDKQIQKRYFDTQREYIYDLNSETPRGLSLEKRFEFFGRRVGEILEEMYHGEDVPDHLIHVTCTGYLSPSAPQIYFSSKDIQPKITHAYHMGCYASLPAIRMAQALAHSHAHKVDVVHNEICSLHLDPALHTPEQMVVQTLFADGHIKYRVDHKHSGPRLELKSVEEKMIPDSALDMTWMPSSHQMQMTLSKEVPEKIRAHLPGFLRSFNVSPKCLFAIHPGGPKIIDLIQKHLELSDEQIHFSRKILRERGNMSSATLPHMWKEILESDYTGEVISLAFGPGLTIFGSHAEVKR